MNASAIIGCSAALIGVCGWMFLEYYSERSENKKLRRGVEDLKQKNAQKQFALELKDKDLARWHADWHTEKIDAALAKSAVHELAEKLEHAASKIASLMGEITELRAKQIAAPKSSRLKYPRCPCGKLTADRAAKRGHKCEAHNDAGILDASGQ